MNHRKPVLVLATVDPVVRDATIFGLVSDHPRMAVLRHDILDGPDGGRIRRVVMSADGVLHDSGLHLEHACLSCAVREDALPTLERLAADDRWDALLFALPVSAEALPVVRALSHETGRGGRLRGLWVSHVVSALDVEAFEDDLLGDDLLAERDLALTVDDRRSVGEALAAQVAHADTVLVSGAADAHPVGSDLLDHVRAADGVRVEGLYGVDVDVLLRTEHQAHRGERRMDPLHVAPVPGAPTDHGVWTLDLRSPRPMHPERLMEHVWRLGGGRLRGRGRFWVPTRPDSVCVWEGSGGQLSVGDLDRWGRRSPDTRIVVTGTGSQQGELVEAFEEVLMSERELSAGLARWVGVEDVLEPWLGERSQA